MLLHSSNIRFPQPAALTLFRLIHPHSSSPSRSPFSNVEPPFVSTLSPDLDLDLSLSASSLEGDDDLDLEPLAFFNSLSLLLSRLADLLDRLDDLLESSGDFDLDRDLDPSCRDFDRDFDLLLRLLERDASFFTPLRLLDLERDLDSFFFPLRLRLLDLRDFDRDLLDRERDLDLECDLDRE